MVQACTYKGKDFSYLEDALTFVKDAVLSRRVVGLFMRNAPELYVRIAISSNQIEITQYFPQDSLFDSVAMVTPMIEWVEHNRLWYHYTPDQGFEPLTVFQIPRQSISYNGVARSTMAFSPSLSTVTSA